MKEIIFAKYEDTANKLQIWHLLFTPNIYVTLYYSVAKPYTIVRLRTMVEMINYY